MSAAGSDRLELWSPEDLHPAPHNPRVHGADDLAELQASIARFGFRAPILATGSGEIVAGEGRWRAAKALGLEEVPVVIVEGLSDDERQAYLVADNRVAELSTWDEAELAAVLEGANLEGVGFTDEELEGWGRGEEVEEEEDPAGEQDPGADELPELRADPVTAPGDVWTLGDHRLACGDSGDPATITAVLEGRTATAIVTDPPYGLGFMGKGWDRGVPPAALWAGLLAHLAPGGHALVFGGTRAFHRLTCGLEDAGFEIRDCLLWLYGSGFPKSLDVSKALDNAAGVEREPAGEPYRVPDAARTRPHFVRQGDEPGATTTYQPTAPATDDARTWEGYGTGLKPAWEPVVVAMKPLEGTFVENALEHGVAGLDIDGARVGTEQTVTRSGPGKFSTRAYAGGKGWDAPVTGTVEHAHPGRWPANLALDEEAAAALDGQSGESTSKGYTRRSAGGQHGIFSEIGDQGIVPCPTDTGGASRFFYVAKASRADRGEDNTHPTVKPSSLIEWLLTLTRPPAGANHDGDLVLEPFAGSGTTIIAAERIGRPVAAVELDPAYVELAIERWQTLTGETARNADGRTLAELREDHDDQD